MNTMKNKKLVLIGNPNVGKTTLFNHLTGSTQKTGNWAGVTVEKKTGRWRVDKKESIDIVDLPGIYSFTTSTLDELIARDYILNNDFDAVINIVDVSSLRRNLLLTLNLIEMGIPVILALNKADLLHKKQQNFLLNFIKEKLGIPVVLLIAKQKKSLDECQAQLKEIIRGDLTPSSLQITYTEEIKQKQEQISKLIEGESKRKAEWLSLFLLENYKKENELAGLQNLSNQEEIKAILRQEKSNIYTTTVAARYSFISQTFASVFKTKHIFKQNASYKLDSFLLRPRYGIPCFLLVMYLVFVITQNVGNGLVDIVDTIGHIAFVEIPQHYLTLWHVPKWIINVATTGIGTGLHTALGFTPLVFTLFVLLSILEESGYLTRAALVWHRYLNKLGLPGKSLLPMIVGFGCNIPSITSMRTIERKQDKIQLAFMLPLMSCSARLPTYAVFAAVFFVHFQGAIVFSLYLAGCAMAILTGLLIKKSLLRHQNDSSLFMELPRYHRPPMRNIIFSAARRTKHYIFNAGKYIIITVTVLNLLNSYHIGDKKTPDSTILATAAQFVSPILVPTGIQKENWQASVALLSGIFAKEVIIGTLNSLYVQKDNNTVASEAAFPWQEKKEEIIGLLHDYVAQLKTALLDPLDFGSLTSHSKQTVADASGADIGLYNQLQDNFTPWQAYSYLLFLLLYFPCLAAFATLVREMGLGIASLAGGYVTILAWSVATLFYQLTTGRSLIYIMLPFILFLFLLVFFPALNKTAWFQKQLESTEFYENKKKYKRKCKPNCSHC